MTIKLRAETIKRALDTTECDTCGAALNVGAPVLVDLQRGTVYCCRDCAEMDAPIIPLLPDYPRSAGNEVAPRRCSARGRGPQPEREVGA